MQEERAAAFGYGPIDTVTKSAGISKFLWSTQHGGELEVFRILKNLGSCRM